MMDNAPRKRKPKKKQKAKPKSDIQVARRLPDAVIKRYVALALEMARKAPKGVG
jgi:hypothetical protein